MSAGAAQAPDMRPADACDAALLAGLHAACFVGEEAWDAPAMARLLALPGVAATIAISAQTSGEAPQPAGFVMWRQAADEAEIVTLCVLSSWRRAGTGRRLLDAAMTAAARAGARAMYLEAAADNRAAMALYAAAGFTECGRREGYYQRPEGPAADALVLVRRLPAETSIRSEDKI